MEVHHLAMGFCIHTTHPIATLKIMPISTEDSEGYI